MTGSDENLIFFANLVLAAERMQRISNRDQVHLVFFIYYILLTVASHFLRSKPLFFVPLWISKRKIEGKAVDGTNSFC